MHGHTHESPLPIHPGSPNVNVDPKVDGRLPGGGRVPGSGAMTNPSEWTTKPDYQIGRGEHSDWAAQETYAQIPGIPADSKLYFQYPGLEEYWSADEGEVPEPYVVAAYIKWFVSSWEHAYDKEGKSEPVQSASIEDIAAAVSRREPEILSVLSQCATDHHNVAEISRDTVSRALKADKADGKASTSVVPYAVQHLVEILPNTRSDFRLSDRASVPNSRRLKANSHAAGAGSSLDPKHPKRSLSWGHGKRKNQPDQVIHHAQEQIEEASEKFAKLAFRNGNTLSKSIADAVAKNTQQDYDTLPEYVGSPVARTANHKGYHYELEVELPGRKLSVFIDPVRERVIDGVGTTLVRYDKNRTVLCFGADQEIIIDEPLSYEDAMLERSRYNALYKSTGGIALSSEAPADTPNGFVYRYSDIATRTPVLSRAETGSPLLSDNPNIEREKPKKLLDVRLSNGEVLHVFNDGTTRLNDGTVISKRTTSQKDGGVFTAVQGPDKPLLTKEVLSPLRAYKNYMLLNRASHPGENLNAIWRVQGNRRVDRDLRRNYAQNAQNLGLQDGDFRVQVGDGVETGWHILGTSTRPVPESQRRQTESLELEGPGGNVITVTVDELLDWQFL